MILKIKIPIQANAKQLGDTTHDIGKETIVKRLTNVLVFKFVDQTTSLRYFQAGRLLVLGTKSCPRESISVSISFHAYSLSFMEILSLNFAKRTSFR